jgi:5-hydroxyisourate hydrolase-like protein (transthyretin family)
MISGIVTDPGTGAPVPVAGIRVRFDDDNDGEHATVQRTDRAGRYRLWLRPDKYTVLARGQSAPVDARDASQTADFTAAVGEVKMVLKDRAGNPVSQVKAHLRKGASDPDDGDIISKEASNSDGTVSVYSVTSEPDALLELKIDSGQMIGSTIYRNRRRLLGGNASGIPIAVTVGAVTDLEPITLPAGGVLSGTVKIGNVPTGEIRVQVRNGGTGNGARFVQTRTQSDGTYSISLPEGTYSRICAVAPGQKSSTCPSEELAVPQGAGYAFADNRAVAANAITTLNLEIP